MALANENWNRRPVERFEYPAVTHTPIALEAFELPDFSEEDRTAKCAPSVDESIPQEDFGAEKNAEEMRQTFAAGREQGFEEGRVREREAQTSALRAAEAQAKHQALKSIGEFAAERDRYLLAVEKEVVKLALAVAARILRREAQMDPLLLTGAVRVALGQLSGSTEVRLKIPPAELDLWRDAIALFPNLPVKPQVIAGEGMRIGDCVIETALGSVDLGVRSQLGEIERGFFDHAGYKKPESGAEAGTAPAEEAR